MITQADLTCQEFVALVTDYLEGALSSTEVARLEDHLSDCPGCRVYLEQMRQTIRTLGVLPQESIPADAKDELLRVFRRWKREQRETYTGHTRQ